MTLSEQAAQTTANPRVPPVVHRANVVIAGGGPCGSLAAALLNHRGVSVTLVERNANFLKFNANYAYALGFTPPAFKVMDTVPGLMEHLNAWNSSISEGRGIHPDKTVTTMPMLSGFRRFSFFMRYRISYAMHEFVRDRTDVRVMSGAEVCDVVYLPNGDMDVTIRTRDGKDGFELSTVRTNMVLACDGRNSTVLDTLRNAEKNNEHVRSSNGFEVHARTSPSVGLCLKSVLVRWEETYAQFGIDKSSFKGRTTRLMGDAKGRPANRIFALTVFPTVVGDIDHMKGVLGVIVRKPDHALWTVQTLEEAYELFEENFPQIDVRKSISPESMATFISQRPSPFPTICRPASLVAHVGDGKASGKGGGVFVIGDAAHSFPPDTGQGVNSGIEDLEQLMNVFEKAADTSSVSDLLHAYEQARDKDVWALMRIVEVAAPYQYGQALWIGMLMLYNVAGRRFLNKWLPRLFSPSLVDLLALDLSYDEMLKLADRTTRHLYLSVLSLVACVVPALLYLLYFTAT